MPPAPATCHAHRRRRRCAYAPISAAVSRGTLRAVNARSDDRYAALARLPRTPFDFHLPRCHAESHAICAARCATNSRFPRPRTRPHHDARNAAPRSIRRETRGALQRSMRCHDGSATPYGEEVRHDEYCRRCLRGGGLMNAGGATARQRLSPGSSALRQARRAASVVPSPGSALLQ